MCYIKLGKYNNALEYYQKALSIDKNNDISINIKKELYKKGLIKKHKGKKILISILVISIVSSASIYLFNKFNKPKNIDEIKNNKIISKENKNNSNIPKKEEVKKAEIKKTRNKKGRKSRYTKFK